MENHFRAFRKEKSLFGHRCDIFSGSYFRTLPELESNNQEGKRCICNLKLKNMAKIKLAENSMQTAKIKLQSMLKKILEIFPS
jgi:hypothetical protein